MKFKRYEYPITDKNGNTYYGSYTIKVGVKSLGFQNEKLVQVFEAKVKGE